MKDFSIWGKPGVLVMLALTFAGCSAIFNQPLSTEEPSLGTTTHSEKRLKKLPPPKEKITAAVYNFRDKTGQYKLTETGGSWSTAVTQGATSVLINALDESNWFTPIEREGLGNLLNERKIIRSSREAFNQGNSNSPSLPPLLFAGIVLEGGIISYDHNVQTGGLGLRYFGAGGSGEYRQDRVTVYLRAVSTRNGKILKTVNTTKTVLSQKIDAGIFRYVKFKRLLEAETGITYNEPTEIAVKEAIEKAVESLIIEGLFDNLWELKNPDEINSDIIQNYIQDKAENEKSDIFGSVDKARTHDFSVKAEGGVTRYSGDYTHSLERPLLNLQFGYELDDHIYSFASLGKYYMAAKNRFYEAFNYLNLGMAYRLFPRKSYTPFATMGVGASVQSHKTIYNVGIPEQFNKSTFSPQIRAGIGLEYLLGRKRQFGINSSLNVNYFFFDGLDHADHGNLNDYFWDWKLGLAYYF